MPPPPSGLSASSSSSAASPGAWSSALTPVPSAASGPTLLPSPIASTISLISKSTSVSLRLSSYITSAVLSTARSSTLTSLALSRAAVEAVLFRSSRAVARRDTEVEGWANRGVDFVQSSLALTELLVSTAFELGQTTVDTVSALAENYVFTLDSLFGCTESSRAVAAIVALVREEYKDASEHDGEVKKRDVLAGITCFAVLQWRSRARLGGEESVELVWDVVVDMEAEKDDDDDTVVGDLESCSSSGEERKRLSTADEGLPAVVLSKLPPNAEISMTTSSTTTSTTTIEVVGTSPPDFTPPSDAVVISESSHHDGRQKYKIVYQTITSNTKTKRLKREDGGDITTEMAIETDGEDDMDEGRVYELESCDEASDKSRGVSRKPEAGRILVEPDTPPPVPEKDGSLQSIPWRPTVTPPTPGASTPTSPVLTPRVSSSRQNGRECRSPTGIPRPVEANQRKRITNPTAALGEKRKKTGSKGKDTDRSPKKHSALRKAFSPSSSFKSDKDKKKYPLNPTPPPNTRPTPSGSKSDSRHDRLSTTSAGLSRPRNQDASSPKRQSARPSTPDLRPPRTSSSRNESRRHRSSSISSNSDSPNLTRRDSYSVRDSRPSSVLSIYTQHDDGPPTPPRHTHRRVPSIYTLHTAHSTSSLLLYNTPSPDNLGPYYPAGPHLLQNLRKYIRFSAASYGAHFMRLLGIGSPLPSYRASAHPAHHAFSHHTSLPVDTILLSSFADPDGGFDATGKTGTGRPLVHFVCVDHDAAAIVVTCRGTLGLEDVLTDLTCEYTTLTLSGRAFRVHKGILASATLLLRTRLLETLRNALEQYPTYGIVLTGHSLGGGVAALSAILITGFNHAPSSSSSSSTSAGVFVTTHPALPSGRRVHCYAYGPPAIMCESLRRMSRGLITTVVNRNDVVPSLSIGQIRDFHSVALSFREDTAGVMRDIRRKFFRGLLGKGPGVAEMAEEEHAWELAVLKTLRAGMSAEKLVPPGEVWCVSREREVLGAAGEGIPTGRERCRAWVVQDVERRFGEVRFGGGMFGDHSPGEYELTLEGLRRGVCDE